MSGGALRLRSVCYRRPAVTGGQKRAFRSGAVPKDQCQSLITDHPFRACRLRYQPPMSDHASILVVDDEPHVSDMLQEFFLELGYAVDVATTGDEAVRRASSKRPDAVILDMRLPDTTGDQLLTRLRTLDGSVPIVMLSGDTDDDVARRTVAAGAFQYLQKPFDFELLQQTITRAVVAGREHHRLATVGA